MHWCQLSRLQKNSKFSYIPFYTFKLLGQGGPQVRTILAMALWKELSINAQASCGTQVSNPSVGSYNGDYLPLSSAWERLGLSCVWMCLKRYVLSSPHFDAWNEPVCRRPRDNYLLSSSVGFLGSRHHVSFGHWSGKHLKPQFGYSMG